MPTTSNFGWTTPADTDYVKDGALAIRTLGNGIDTSLVDLKGGTTGQILSKASNTDLDYTWINNDQGDITAVNAGTGINVTGGTGPTPTVAIDSTVATLTGNQTLTNKTINGSDNTISNISLTTGVTGTLPIGNGGTNLTTYTTGDIPYASATNTLAKLGIGTAGQVLTVNSGATAPEWKTASSGGMTLISSTTASGTGFSFTSISGSYKALLLIWSGVYHTGGSGDAEFDIRLNNDSGAKYPRIGFGWRQNVGVAIDGADATAIRAVATICPFGTQVNSSTVQYAAKGYLYIDNYASTTLYKNWHGQWGFYDTGAGRYESGLVQGHFEDTAAITSVDIVRIYGSSSLAQLTNTDVRLYGVS